MVMFQSNFYLLTTDSRLDWLMGHSFPTLGLPQEAKATRWYLKITISSLPKWGSILLYLFINQCSKYCKGKSPQNNAQSRTGN